MKITHKITGLIAAAVMGSMVALTLITPILTGCSTTGTNSTPSFNTNLAVALETDLLEGATVVAVNAILAKSPQDRQYFVDVQAGLTLVLNQTNQTVNTLSNVLNQALGTNAATYSPYVTLVSGLWNNTLGALTAQGITSQWWLNDGLVAILDGLNTDLGTPLSSVTRRTLKYHANKNAMVRPRH